MVVYVEKSIQAYPRVQRILARYSDVILCDNYQQVFNPKAQNFRIQKQQPALILAEKKGRKVLPTPEGFGIGGVQNYYFSHMLNCLYDCRYCFLQGMYQSANYVVFVNYEDFMQEIQAISLQHPGAYFFSGYDADSLAYEPVTQFLAEFLPFFEQNPQATLELRTKSANINALLAHQPLANAVVAFSFTPDVISRAVEHKVPLVSKRIEKMAQLAQRGWRLGLRFDPLIYASNYQTLYKELIEQIFSQVNPQACHSVSVGPLRFPHKMYQKLVKLYPEDKLLAHPLEKRGKNYSYSAEIETNMKQFVLQHLQNYLPETLLFECQA